MLASTNKRLISQRHRSTVSMAQVQSNTAQGFPKVLGDAQTNVLSSTRTSEEVLNYITFNQDATCIALGLSDGYKIFNCKPNFGKCFQCKLDESIGKIEMLYCTSLIALVALGEEPGSSPRKLKIVNTKRKATIIDLVFPSTILQIKLSLRRMIVLLEDQIYIYDIRTMRLLHTIETSSNVNGICAISGESSNGNFLAYPCPPKTIAHDSLLVSGLNTNGGLNSVQNNVQSVSNAPNRIGDVILFNTDTLQPISVIEAHKSSLAAMTLSIDGSLLATASDKGTIIRVFSVATGVKLFQFRRGTYTTKIFTLAFSPDNKYVVATSSSGTVHIFRLGEEGSLELKHRRKLNSKKKLKPNAGYETISEENIEGDLPVNDIDEDEEMIQDDGDDSDAEEGDENEDDLGYLESGTAVKQRKLSQESNNSFNSFSSGMSNELSGGTPTGKDRSAPLIDQTRLSVARMLRRSSQSLGRKAAQKMGDFLPSRFSSILEPTRHFASIKINTSGKDVKSIAFMNTELLEDLVPQSYLSSKENQSFSPTGKDQIVSKEPLTLHLLHINVITSEGYFYTYGLDPERGGDCILLNHYYLLE